MPFSRKIEERRQRREAERRDRALERRRDDDLRHEEDERRREEAAAETKALQLQLDAERERRLTRILQARLTRAGERRLVAERTEQRQRILDAILQARRAAEETVEIARLRREQLIEARLEVAADRDREANRPDEGPPEESRARLPPDAGIKPTPKRPHRPGPVEPHTTRRRTRPPDSRERPNAPDDRDTPAASSDSSAARARLREQQQIRNDHAAAASQRREGRRRERDSVLAELAQHQARRSAVRDARLAERRESRNALEAMRAERNEAQRERLAQRDQRPTSGRVRRERIESARAQRIQTVRDEARAGPTTSDRPRLPGVRLEPPAPRDPLTDRLASGVFSGSLPWLTTKANRVITITGEPVVLRGISLIGMARTGVAEALIQEAIAWGANVVRVAIDSRRAFSGAGISSGRDDLHELDAQVRRIAQAGAYTLLSLGGRDDGTATEARGDALAMWRLIAERYADEPAVLFDLDTAPRPSAPDDPDGYRSNWDLWTAWVQMTVAAVRLVHPRALCVVLGLDEGADLRGFPIPGSAGSPIPNLIYATHLTPVRSSHWPAARALARRHPMLVTEWGGSDIDVTWGERTAQALRAEGIGWMAVHASAEPALVRAIRDRFAPTKFGVVVQRAFALSARDTVAAPAWAATP